MDESTRVRIDKWLWAARFFKTRSLAAQAVDLGRVRLDGVRIKPARELHGGERLEIQQGEARIDVIVRALALVRGPAPVARQLYEETPESVARRERRIEQRRTGAEPAQELHGRPTKRDGRTMRRVVRGN
jgi:ribosome-associated heat shock protein Hsp15